MPCYVFVPDDLERAKILATEAYGAKVVAVKGNYDDVNRLCCRGRRHAAVGVREREHAAVLRGGLEVAGVRGRGAARLAPARPCRRADRERRAPDEDPPGVQELIAIGAVEEKPLPRVRRPARGLSARSPRRSGRRRRGHAGQARHDRPLARDRLARGRVSTRSRSPGRPAARSRGARRPRSSTGSACSPRPKGCSPRRRVASRSPNLKRLVERGVIRPEEEAVAFVTGNGYKTIEAFEGTSSRASTSLRTSTCSWALG